ncbi:hypothetical protein [Stenotrophomonas sp.]|uniref:hypothetical protein n=1 Tax=Stenotrophomonas sp. TaxID=69392 RepID=UPI0029BCBFA6|nr:hypothetical protein [Stenotrophomonas sp.]MDX3934142.1 hypothetical protein [Stenotrophomonas sp.]
MSIDQRVESAFEQRSGVTIALPRMLPHTFPDGREGIEYQFAFLRDGARIGGLGLFGTEEFIEGSRDRVYTLDLSPEWVLESVLQFKAALGDTSEDFDFLQSLAEGLVSVFARNARNRFSQRNLAITRIDALVQAGIPVPDEAGRVSDDWIILADLLVPATSA